MLIIIKSHPHRMYPCRRVGSGPQGPEHSNTREDDPSRTHTHITVPWCMMMMMIYLIKPNFTTKNQGYNRAQLAQSALKSEINYIYLADFGDIVFMIFPRKDPSRDTGYVTHQLCVWRCVVPHLPSDTPVSQTSIMRKILPH